MIGVGDGRGWWLLALWAAFFLVLLRKLRRREAAVSVFFLLRPLISRLDFLSQRLRILRRLAFLLFLGAALLTALGGMRLFYSSGRTVTRDLVIVDLSPTLGVADDGEPRLETLRRLLDGYLDGLGDGDTFRLVTAGPRAASAPPRPADRGAREALGALEHADAAADIDGAVRLARTAGEGHDRVLLYTDRPGRWRIHREALSELGDLRTVTFGRPAPNAGIVGFDLQRDAAVPGRYNLWVRIARHRPGGEGTSADFTVTVTGGGVSRSAALACPEGEERELIMAGLDLPAGSLEVRLSPGDAYPADDAVSAGIGGEERLTVYLVTPGNSFLESALAADAMLQARVLEPGEALPGDDGAVFVFDGVVPEGDLPGRALFVQPDRVLPGLEYRTLSVGGTIVEWDRMDPFFRGISLDDLALKTYLQYVDSPSFRSPATVDGHPLIILDDASGRRWAVLAFNPSEGAFVYTPSYPLLMANLLRWAAMPVEGERTYRAVGGVVPLPPEAAGGRVELPRGGQAVTLDEGLPIFTAGLHPGRYRVVGRDRAPLGEFHLNVLDREVTAGPAAPDIGRDGSPDNPAPRERGIQRLELAPWLLLLALLFLAGESLVTRMQTAGADRE